MSIAAGGLAAQCEMGPQSPTRDLAATLAHHSSQHGRAYMSRTLAGNNLCLHPVRLSVPRIDWYEITVLQKAVQGKTSGC